MLFRSLAHKDVKRRSQVHAKFRKQCVRLRFQILSLIHIFEAINITKKYRNTLALNQVSMSVMQGDIYGFIGENGAGKTTMIRDVYKRQSPEFGSIRTLEQNGKVLFCGTDVATALGYTNPRKACLLYTSHSFP